MWVSNLQEGPNVQVKWAVFLVKASGFLSLLVPFFWLGMPCSSTIEPKNCQLWILKEYFLVGEKEMESGYSGHSDNVATLRDPRPHCSRI